MFEGKFNFRSYIFLLVLAKRHFAKAYRIRSLVPSLLFLNAISRNRCFILWVVLCQKTTYPDSCPSVSSPLASGLKVNNFPLANGIQFSVPMPQYSSPARGIFYPATQNRKAKIKNACEAAPIAF